MRRNKRRPGLDAACVALLFALAHPVGAGTRSKVMAVEEKVDGLSQGEYVVRWWQWVNRVSGSVKPFRDPTGAMCRLNQSGNVWFLAGTDGTDDVLRHCTMPADKYIFLPIINMIGFSTPGHKISCDEAKNFAAANNDHLASAEVWIDGRAVANIVRHRVRSPACFDAVLYAAYLPMHDSYFPAATDGYWLMLRPLSPGKHSIRVKARYNNPGHTLGDMEQDFEYQLQLEDPAAKPDPGAVRA